MSGGSNRSARLYPAVAEWSPFPVGRASLPNRSDQDELNVLAVGQFETTRRKVILDQGAARRLAVVQDECDFGRFPVIVTLVVAVCLAVGLWRLADELDGVLVQITPLAAGGVAQHSADRRARPSPVTDAAGVIVVQFQRA